MFDVHIVVVDTVARIAVLILLDNKIYILQIDILDLERKAALLLTLLAREAINNLLDIHLALGRLADVEMGICDRTIAKRYALPSVKAREIDLQTTNVEQRVLLIVLDIESIQSQAAQRTQTDAVDLDTGLQKLRQKRGCTVDNEVLNRGQLNEHSEHNRTKYQKQNRD